MLDKYKDIINLPHHESFIHKRMSLEERAYQFLLKHPPRGKSIRESAFRKLVSKGYSVSAASKSAARYMQENAQ